MKYEIVMRDLHIDREVTVTQSFCDSYMYGDLAYVFRCLAQCLFRVQSNGFKVARYIYRNCNGHVALWGFIVDTGQSYSVRKAIKQEKFNSS